MIGMQTIPFNINNYVLVRLTEDGINELKRQHNELLETIPNLGEFKPPAENSDGWSKWQMHHLISSLGHMCYMGGELPFETDIEIVTKATL